MLEIAIGTSVSWLWGKLADTAEAKDKEIAIKKALEESISQSYNNFQNKYGTSSESFFNQEFLENHICPEILKYLTRNQHPDLESVTNALPVNAIFVSENGFRDEIKDFFNMVMDSMKSHEILQEIINRIQIEETYQRTKDIQKEQKATNRLLEQSFEKISFEQEQENIKISGLASQTAEQHAELINVMTGLQSQLSATLPDTKGNGLSELLTKQLDKARDLINDGRANDAHELLIIIEEEIALSDNYTRFRWHTNVGACNLAFGQRKEAAEQYFTAYNFAKNEEKAVANRIRAYLIIDKFDDGFIESEKALNEFPNSGLVWALHINAMQLLNNKFDESLIPSKLHNDSTILLMLSNLKLHENKFEESFILAQKSFEQDKFPNDAKRAMLASALSWITADTVKSYYRQFSVEQHDALKFAVDSFGEIIPFLKNIQSKSIFTEVAHNLTVAMELLDDQKTKNNISAYSFSMYPNENVFLWYKVKELRETNDNEAIHELTDNILDELEKPLLFTLAEISSNKGDIEWNEVILKHLSAKKLEKQELDELFGLKICVMWQSGDKSTAIKLAREHLPQIYSYPSLLSFYIRMLDECGEIEERDKLLLSCTNIGEKSSSHDVLQIADLLYNFDRYFEAANLYGQIIESPSDDYLTKRYLDSLIKSDQRAKAGSTLGLLDDEIRNQSPFKRIEANLARASGDLDRLEHILKDELQCYPSDSGLAAGYIATLYRKSKLDELHSYLSKNPVYDPIIEANEIEIAKYQMELGLEYQAMLRMYGLFRSHPNSSKIAGHFLLLVLLAKQIDTFKSLNNIAAGTAIYLESDGHKQTVVIEPKNFSTENGWPECVNEDTDLAKKLIGHCVGDLIDIDINIGAHKATIVNIESMFIFASNRAHKVVADSVASAGPVWSVNVKKPDGEYDFSLILESVKSRSQHVERVFNVYDDKKLPLQVLADALGSDVVTLLLEWPYKQFDLFVGAGIYEEREKFKGLINEGGKSYVIDLSCLVELNRLSMLDNALVLLGRPLVTASLKEQLLRIIHIHNKMNPDGMVSEIDGQLTYQKIPVEHLEARKNFLNSLLKFIDDCCEVVPVIGPDVVTEQQTTIGELIGYSSHDAIYLALERDAILVSEDGGFRSIAKGMGVTSCTWIQPLLMILRDRNAISEDQYSRCILDKITLRHDFTSVTANDLLWAAKSYPDSIAPDVESAFETFKKPTLDLTSGVVVGSQFLEIVAKRVNPNTLYQYYKLILDVLSFGREIYTDDIHESLRAHIVSALSQIKYKKAKLIIRKFGDKLAPPKPKPISIKPIVRAIRRAIRR